MLALQYSQFGEAAEVITPVEVERPEPGKGQVRLRLLRSPIHNHDLATIRGVYGVKPALPAIGGSELLGIVDEIGEGSDAIEIGTRVACMTQAAWAEYTLVSAGAVIPVPDAIPDDIASQLLAMPTSVLGLLDDLHVQSGDWIVINAANGAVGRILIREARDRGINVVGLVRSVATAQQLQDSGAPHVVVTEGSWETELKQITGGAPIVRAIDSVAGNDSMQLQRLLAARGELIIFGGLSGQAMRLDPGLMIYRELTVRGFWMYTWAQRPENSGRMLSAVKRVFELAAAGELPLSAGGVYALDDARAALKAAETPGRPGKILFKRSEVSTVA